MARIKVMDGGDRAKVIDYLAPIVGSQAVTTATAAAGVFLTAISIPTVVATDVATAQLLTSSTVDATICYVTVTAGTGIGVYLSKHTIGTIGYAVFHANEA
jgi:hypothetical protein